MARIACIQVQNGIEDISKASAETYSRMKHGDPIATQQVAELLFKRIVEEFEEQCDEGFPKRAAPSAFYVVGSPKKDVAKAATWCMRFLMQKLVTAGYQPQEVEVYQGGDAGLMCDFAKLSLEEREAEYAKRKLRFANEELMAKQYDVSLPIFCVDDCCITGTHERAMHKFLVEDVGVPEHLIKHMYFIVCSPSLPPHVESELNQSYVKKLDDMSWYTRPGQGLVNVRTMKFIFAEKSATDAEFQKFLNSLAFENMLALSDCLQLEGGFAENKQYVDRVRKFLAALEERQEKSDTSVNTMYRSESEISVSACSRRSADEVSVDSSSAADESPTAGTMYCGHERLSKCVLLTNSVFSMDKVIQFEGKHGGCGIGKYRKQEDLLQIQRHDMSLSVQPLDKRILTKEKIFLKEDCPAKSHRSKSIFELILTYVCPCS